MMKENGKNSSNFKVINNIFDGIKFDITKHPTELYSLFKNFRHIKIEIIMGVYFISFRKLFIASVKDYELELTPNIFIHDNIQVFKTYNRILRTIINKKLFLKFLNKQWVLCEEIEHINKP